MRPGNRRLAGKLLHRHPTATQYVLAGALVCVLLAAGYYRHSLTTENLATFVAVRDWLFTRMVGESTWRRDYVADSGRFAIGGLARDSREELSGFLWEVPSAASVAALSQMPASATQRIRFVVRALPGTGGGSCGEPSALVEMAKALMAGSGLGCCSDFSKVFTALAELAGLQVRQVMNRLHSYDEVWDSTVGGWLFVDPRYGLMAQDDSSRFLSALALADRVVNGQNVHWIQLKDTASQGSSVRWRQYYSASAFDEMRLVLGADVVHQDLVMRKFRLLPKPAAQLVAFLFFGRPRYLGFARVGISR